MPTPLYDAFSQDYDRFVDWEGRLAYEMPFILTQLERAGAHRILDVACGTGQHALALANSGYRVTGADISAGMIQRAKANALQAGSDVEFVVAGFGQHADVIAGSFDAALVLGNSVPHILRIDELNAALVDLYRELRPGGVLMIQNRNFDLVLAQRNRWMPNQEHVEGEREWIFSRFYDWDDDGLITFNVVTLFKDGAAPWRSGVDSTRLWPMRSSELVKELESTGFDRIELWGDMLGNEYDAEKSPNLIITARSS